MLDSAHHPAPMPTAESLTHPTQVIEINTFFHLVTRSPVAVSRALARRVQ